MYSNFVTPGNDVMSAILSLLIETLIYGFVIITFVTMLLCACVTFFSADCAAKTEEYDAYIDHYAKNDASDLEQLWDGVSTRRRFPSYFTKRAESILDICFLVFPTLAVMWILVPTLGFLYNTEFFLEHVNTAMSIDVIGHQWYWSYEYRLDNYSDFCQVSFDSILDVDAVENANLEVDRRVVIPTDVYISVTVTSADVIHSWAVPQLGLKVDAVPGRLSNAVLYTFMDGVYFGQCSELCGVLHGFMPICVESVPFELFFFWVFLNQISLPTLDLFAC